MGEFAGERVGIRSGVGRGGECDYRGYFAGCVLVGDLDLFEEVQGAGEIGSEGASELPEQASSGHQKYLNSSGRGSV